MFGDDPTVNELEARAAALLGKEAGLFVASGTMGNLVSLMAHLPRGYEAIAGETTHTVLDEAGGHAVVVGATIRALRERADGTLDPARDRGGVPRPRRTSTSPSPAWSSSRTRTRTRAASHCRSRTWNASPPSRTIAACRSTSTAPASSTRPSRWASHRAALAAPADTVTFCLSKGLSAPIGSVVVGTGAVHRPRPPRPQAPRRRHAPGGRAGGGRPRGAATTARTGPIARLAEDHANARRLAEGLAELAGDPLARRHRPAGRDGPLDPSRAVTNFVLFRVARDRAAFLAALEARGVLMVPYAHGQIRAVTHLGVTADDIDRVVAAAADALRETDPSPAAMVAGTA